MCGVGRSCLLSGKDVCSVGQSCLLSGIKATITRKTGCCSALSVHCILIFRLYPPPPTQPPPFSTSPSLLCLAISSVWIQCLSPGICVHDCLVISVFNNYLSPADLSPLLFPPGRFFNIPAPCSHFRVLPCGWDPFVFLDCFSLQFSVGITRAPRLSYALLFFDC